MVQCALLAARRAGVLLTFAVLAAMVLFCFGCGDAPVDPGTEPQDNTPGDTGGGDDGGSEPSLITDDFVAGEGAAEGFVYVNPARSASVRQRTRNNFILSATAIGDGIVPTAGTQVMVSGSSLAATLDGSGHYQISGIPAQVATLAVTEVTSGGQTLSEAFEGIAIVPGHTTHGADPPTGVTIAITPGGGPVDAGGLLELTAALRDSSGAIDGFRDFDWASDSPSVASVLVAAGGKGEVRALGEGQAQIIASAGGIEGAVTVTVAGSVESPGAALNLTAALSAEGPDTRLATFDVGGPEGGGIAISNGGSASFVIGSPNGSTRVVSAIGDSLVIRPESSPLIASATSGAGWPASVTLSPSGGSIVLTAPEGGTLSIRNRIQISFPITGPGQGYVPTSARLSLPMTGSYADAGAELRGLPDGTAASLMIATQSGSIVRGTGTAQGGTLAISNFPDVPAGGDITDIVLSLTAPG